MRFLLASSLLHYSQPSTFLPLPANTQVHLSNNMSRRDYDDPSQGWRSSPRAPTQRYPPQSNYQGRRQRVGLWDDQDTSAPRQQSNQSDRERYFLHPLPPTLPLLTTTQLYRCHTGLGHRDRRRKARLILSRTSRSRSRRSQLQQQRAHGRGRSILADEEPYSADSSKHR